MARFLDQFPVVLLDMNGTFMFGHDRFGPNEDYYATYRALGGRRLQRQDLVAIWNPSLETMLRIYDTPERIDDFPSLAEVFATHGAASDDIAILEGAFAAHEIGEVPAAHAETLRQLARTHDLGVVSNLCSHPKSWLATCTSAPVFGLFQTLVFSSEGRSIKPSPAIFQRALAHFPREVPILFVGDSLERDTIPAKALGMSTAWIAPDGCSHPAADCVVRSLTDLPARSAHS